MGLRQCPGAVGVREVRGSGCRGHRIGEDAVLRVMVRSADAQVPGDPEKVVADFDDPGSLRAALEGVRRAYLVTPSSAWAERQQLDFVDAARAAGVERLVVLSQLGSVADSPVRFLRYHAAVEQHVRDSGSAMRGSARSTSGGEASEVTDVVDTVVGRPAISFAQFVHDYADRFARP